MKTETIIILGVIAYLILSKSASASPINTGTGFVGPTAPGSLFSVGGSCFMNDANGNPYQVPCPSITVA